MNRGLDQIQIQCGGSLGNSDDLINFWEEFFKNKMVDQTPKTFKKNSQPKSLWAQYLINRSLDRIQI